MLSLPFFPQLPRAFKVLNHAGRLAMNFSFVTFHPKEKEGNVAYLLLGPNLEEPSRRTVACNI